MDSTFLRMTGEHRPPVQAVLPLPLKAAHRIFAPLSVVPCVRAKYLQNRAFSPPASRVRAFGRVFNTGKQPRVRSRLTRLQ
jgi:hypothetical protein